MQNVNNNLKLLQNCPPVWYFYYLHFAGMKMETYPTLLKPDHNKPKTLNKNCTKLINVPQHSRNTHLFGEMMISDSQLQENKQLYSQYHVFFFKIIPH